MRNLVPIALHLSLALLITLGTAGVAVHEHLCPIMGASASLAQPPSCCSGEYAGAERGATLSARSCCGDELRSAVVDGDFMPPVPPRAVQLPFAPLPVIPAGVAVSWNPVCPSADDISPHIRCALSESVNNLLA